jgi:acid phosphatase
MTICWETTNGAPGVVLFGKGSALDRQAGPIQPMRVDIPADATNKTASSPGAFFVYEAVLTGLLPGATYQYAIQCGGQRGGQHSFTTLDPAKPDVTFIVYGDSRSGPDVHQKLAEQFPAYKPSFILHSGDLVSKGEKYSLWGRQFFFPLARVIDHIPMLPSIGNHEGNGANYLAYFHLPPPERYYSFDAGPVHVLVLDDHKTSDQDEQFAFAKKDLSASRAPWKVVLLHAPMFNLGGHKSFWKGNSCYLPLFRSNQVDVVFAGHSHIYERFRPLVPRAEPGAWPIQHITSGGGGAPLYETVTHPALLAVAKKYHFLVIHATAEKFAARVIDVDGQEFDRFTIGKRNGILDPDWRSQCAIEEDVQDAGTRRKKEE